MAYINGTPGDDTLNGTGGADTMRGGLGDDILNGGAGNDIIVGVEGDDTLNGGAGADRLEGRDGADSLLGGADNDILVGGDGADHLDGGTGTDRVLYSSDGGTLGVTVDLDAGTATDTYGRRDTLVSIEYIYGSDFGDRISGASAERDFLFGEAGDDTIDGRGKDDILIGGAGRDRLIGGAGNDQVAYNLESGGSGVTVDLEAGTAIDTFGNRDTLVSIEYVVGTDFGDALYGSNRDGDRIYGGDGNDTLDGRDGDNLIQTGAGDDEIHVGVTLENARDTIVVDGGGNKSITGTGAEGSAYGHHLVFQVDEGVNVNLATGIAYNSTMRTDFSEALYFIELGGTSYADVLTGGNPNHDHIEWYVGNQGNDTINGGTGTGDTVNYQAEVVLGSYVYELGAREYATQGVSVNLSTGVGIDAYGDRDTLINIEQIRATRYADRITGDAENNAFWTFAGNDTIDGGGGEDRIHYDEDFFTGLLSGVTVDLAAGTATDDFGDTDTLINIEHVHATGYGDLLYGDAGSNRLFGYDGQDSLHGRDGNDVLVGGAGDDTLNGAADDDELWGDAGDDTLNGGEGQDLARYLEDPGGVTVDLAAGTATDGHGDHDTLISIEDVHTSQHGDNVRGSGGANRIFGYGGRDTISAAGGDDVVRGGDGNDTIHGGAGDDEIWGEAGSDTLNGGEGRDMARYLEDPGGVTVDLDAGTATDGHGDRDTLISIENVHGSDHGDTLRGGSGDNWLFGFGGNDTISAASGNDVVRGGAGNDSIHGGGGGGNDEIWGEAGDDTLNGGDGLDTARYLEDPGGVTVDLTAGTATDGHGDHDTLISIENVHGSEHGDMLRGNVGDNWLFGFGGRDMINSAGGNDVVRGGDGNDSISGGAGNDELWGEAGADTLSGGSGNDVVRYVEDQGAVTVNLAGGIAVDGHGHRDTLIGIENVHGSAHGDTLMGDSGANRLFGFGGADTISANFGNDVVRGGDGNDSISGGAGDDELWGEVGADTLDGGAGEDIARYLEDTSGVVVDLAAGLALDGNGHRDTLLSVEHAHGSDFGDTLRGDSDDNRLFGYGGNDQIGGNQGNDVLRGGAGNDSLSGGAGDDEIWGEEGRDTLDGGTGADIARYLEDSAGVDVNLATGVAIDGSGGRDTLIDIEHVHGSQHDDTIRGDGGDNRLFGFGGNDLLQGAGGNDVLMGSVDNDRLEGGTGDDELWGEAGDDTIDGGAGFDIARYLDDPGGIMVNLTTGVATDGHGGRDTLIGIEHVHGSEFNDTIRGDGNDNRLYGFGGRDVLSGSAGNNVILGGDGNDSIDGGAGNDEIWGESGADTLDGGAGTDLARYLNSPGAVSVDLQKGTASDGFGFTDRLVDVENLHGSQFADWLGDSSADNQLFGQGGNDTLIGGMGADTLAGGTGGDTYIINGGGGTDVINDLGEVGGDADRVIFASFLAQNAAVFRQGGGTSDTVVFHFGVSGDIAIVANAYDANHASAIELFEFGDGTVWSHSDLVAAIAAGAPRVDASRVSTDDDDALSGSSTADRLDGGNGDDLLTGFAGDDTLSGGAGNDTLRGGRGDDTLGGGSGNDLLVFTSGNDVLNGGAGSDVADIASTVAQARIWTSATGGFLIETANGEVALANDIETIVFEDRSFSSAQLAQYVAANPPNIAPTLEIPTELVSRRGDVTLNLAAYASDPEGDTLVFSASGMPDGATMDAASGQMSGTLAGRAAPYVVQVSVEDGSGNVTSDVFEWFIDTSNATPEGDVTISGNTRVGETLTVSSTVTDQDGINAVSEVYQWTRNGTDIPGAEGASYDLTSDDLGASIGVAYRYADDFGTSEEVLATSTANVAAKNVVESGTSGADNLQGGDGDDSIEGFDGNDRLIGGIGNDTLNAGDGADTLNGGDGDDVMIGGETEADLRDVIYGLAGNDSADGGYGNDLMYGGDGNDTLEGGFGVDEVIGQGGDDVLTGSAWSDAIFGGDGNDFINGGFGFDRVNGGAGADRFFHIGVQGHGSDWIQDYTSADGDVLHFGRSGATAADFRVNFANTPNAGDSDDSEAFVIYLPTRQILWALVDGGSQDEINIQIGGEVFDLLG